MSLMVAAGAFLKAVSGTISTAPGVRLISRRAWSVLGTVRLGEGRPAEGSTDSDRGAAWDAAGAGCVWAGADWAGRACLTVGLASTVTLGRTAGVWARANSVKRTVAQAAHTARTRRDIIDLR